MTKRYDKFGIVKRLTLSRKQWYKNFENPSKFILIVHLLLSKNVRLASSSLFLRFKQIEDVQKVLDVILIVHLDEIPVEIILLALK